MEKTVADWTEIANLTPNSKNINLRFLVIDMKQPRRTFSKRTGKENELVECTVADSSAKISLVLWNDDIDSIEPQHTYDMRNGCINLYDECMTLTKGHHGEISESKIKIEKINDEIDMSKPFMGRLKRKSKRRSSTGRSFDGAAGRDIPKYCGRKSF